MPAQNSELPLPDRAGEAGAKSPGFSRAPGEDDPWGIFSQRWEDDPWGIFSQRKNTPGVFSRPALRRSLMEGSTFVQSVARLTAGTNLPSVVAAAGTQRL
jgi:hypothetical protein